MSHPKANSFTSYELSEDEQRAAHTLSSLNISFIQNLRAAVAEEKLALEFTPNDLNTFLQREAHLKGQLDVLNYILACNEEAQQHHNSNHSSIQS